MQLIRGTQSSAGEDQYVQIAPAVIRVMEKLRPIFHNKGRNSMRNERCGGKLGCVEGRRWERGGREAIQK